MSILLTTSVTHAYAQGEESNKPLVIKVKPNPFVSETFSSPKPVPKNEVDQAKLEQGVYGDYSSESTSLTFYNVEPGYYKLRISNWGEQNLAGNGFTFY